MSLKHTILGFLSWKKMTGYEIKKYFSQLEFIPWQGNNNQIYKTLLEVEKEELVSKKTVLQDNYPPQKIYSITLKGMSELRNWVMSDPELPLTKNTFVMQLAWAGSMDNETIFKLIDKYQYELEMKISLLKEMLKRKTVLPDRSQKESYIWEMLWQNRINLFQSEINWVTQLRNGLANK